MKKRCKSREEKNLLPFHIIKTSPIFISGIRNIFRFNSRKYFNVGKGL